MRPVSIHASGGGGDIDSAVSSTLGSTLDPGAAHCSGPQPAGRARGRAARAPATHPDMLVVDWDLLPASSGVALVALLMGLDLGMRNQGESEPSIYESRGMVRV